MGGRGVQRDEQPEQDAEAPPSAIARFRRYRAVALRSRARRASCWRRRGSRRAISLAKCTSATSPHSSTSAPTCVAARASHAPRARASRRIDHLCPRTAAKHALLIKPIEDHRHDRRRVRANTARTRIERVEHRTSGCLAKTPNRFLDLLFEVVQRRWSLRVDRVRQHRRSLLRRSRAANACWSSAPAAGYARGQVLLISVVDGRAMDSRRRPRPARAL